MTPNPRAQITPGGEAVVLINVYEVAPERQDELAQLLGEVTEAAIRDRPGFVSVCIHKSLDGTQVVNYAQWASKPHFDQMLKDPAAQAQFRRLAGVARGVAPVLYQVAAVHLPGTAG
ncbi:antibiotic biosynthesis monooxygenase [Geothrix sp. 21YS21S-4]|uniref:antibiotic biosynthesis monooxygenase family protein n=1 Tax=Geothrix sp. 21YS21S-4 TaxID=3068889 RepID=UPI0027B921B5|nr:antibiotic biosynthesis monooxygenase family protein [Geothrix sp. 21YS21S-4]